MWVTEPLRSFPCELSEPDLAVRAEEWRALRPLVLSRVRTAEGYRVAFDRAALERVDRLAEAERTCCGWATWSVEAHPDHVALEVTGPEAPVVALAVAFEA